jgi:hypothetical protein
MKNGFSQNWSDADTQRGTDPERFARHHRNGKKWRFYTPLSKLQGLGWRAKTLLRWLNANKLKGKNASDPFAGSVLALILLQM